VRGRSPVVVARVDFASALVKLAQAVPGGRGGT
jgi:hypothetical protein